MIPLIIGAGAFILFLLVGLAWAAGYFTAKAMWGCPTPNVHTPIVIQNYGPPQSYQPVHPSTYTIQGQDGYLYEVSYVKVGRRLDQVVPIYSEQTPLPSHRVDRVQHESDGY